MATTYIFYYIDQGAKNQLSRFHSNNKINYIYNLLPMNILTNTLLTDLRGIIEPSTLTALSLRLSDEAHRNIPSNLDEKRDTSDIATPSTIHTNMKRGSALSKAKRSVRPDSKSKEKNTETLRSTQLTIGKWVPEGSLTRKQEKEETNEKNGRKILSDRAVFYGNVDLPYLHSSDAIASLYEKRREDKTLNEPLINPSAGIASHFLSNLKSLYLYYTGIDSLRQLGTGWSNLKSLTIMCSRELKDLSGLSIFPSLEHLYVPNNNIAEISDLMYHGNLRCVDLHGNDLSLMEQVEYIYTICNLQWVDVSNNPITNCRQKYRIIKENLGRKIEQECDERVQKYILQQMQLEQEINSYENIQNSNNLIKEINEQIVHDCIHIGQYWRNVARNSSNQTQDIQIIDHAVPDFQQNQQDDLDLDPDVGQHGDEEGFEENGVGSDQNGTQVRLRVTPLISYIGDELDLAPLKKYFANKVCLQVKADSGKEESARQPIINEDRLTKKLAATQSLARNISEEKVRMVSNSHHKRKLGKLSLPKNSIKMSSTQLNPKEETPTNYSGIKFLARRHLLGKSSEKTCNDR